MFKLAPSILSADFSRLGEQTAAVEAGGADMLHIDVMDGHFVPNISFGASVMKSLIGRTGLSFDVHLMIEDPDRFIGDFVTDHTEFITVHQEACVHLHRTLAYIRSFGVKAGVALNPATPLEMISEILSETDLVLIMSVNPGFGGQKFIESSVDKIRRLKALREKTSTDFLIETDGGVNLINRDKLISAGCDILVAGSAVFGAEDVTGRTLEFKK